MKSRSTWRLDKTDDYAAYNLLAAVCGPDASEHVALGKLKKIVTERVRGIVFEDDMTAGDWRDDPLDEQEVKEVRAIYARLLRRNQQYHLLQHMREAVVASIKHPIWGGLGNALWAALNGYKD